MSQTTGNTSHELRRSWFQVGDELQSDSGGLYRGERFTLLGFGERYIGRGGFTHKDAGVYIDFGVLHVIRKHGKKMFARADSFEKEPGQSTHEQMGAVQIKIHNLPETPFWEGDLVSIKPEACGGQFSNKIADMRYTVTSIEYSTGAVGDFRVRMMSQGVSGCGPISVINLVERGNIWKLARGEPLDFTDIEEEAKFHQSLGMSQKVILAEQPAYQHSFIHAVRMIKEGNADQIKMKDKKMMTFVLIRYEDRTFGERVRQDTLRHLRSFESAGGHPVL